MEIPISKKINTAGLSASFKNVTNSYKYFWLWAILDSLAENGEPFITYEDISMRMISLVWYPLDYYKLSFGKQDSFKLIASFISESLPVDNSVNSKPLLVQIQENLDKKAVKRINKEITETLKRYVSCRFLSSFFSSQIKGIKDYRVNSIIKNLSNEPAFSGSVPYKIENNGILIDSLWQEYFGKHHQILKGFIKWNLVQFLQKNNPYVIGLSEKLEKPVLRNLAVAKSFWTKFINEMPTNCIYSRVPINKANLSLDHFIPWSYVAHDRLWNIIPTTKSINSSKSDALPSLEHYFAGFCDTQFNAVKFHFNRASNEYLEDYYSLMNFHEIGNLSQDEFKNMLLPEIENNIRTAKNLGFQYPFIYRSETL